MIFGNQGQDDIIGGSSDLFTLTRCLQRRRTRRRPATLQAARRCRTSIFGGSGGSDIARQRPRRDRRRTASAHDADTIVANNGDIVRLVGTVGAPQAGFLPFGYDTRRSRATAASGSSRGPSRCSTTRRAAPTWPARRAPVVTGRHRRRIVPGASRRHRALVLRPDRPGQALGSEIHGEPGRRLRLRRRRQRRALRRRPERRPHRRLRQRLDLRRHRRRRHPRRRRPDLRQPRRHHGAALRRSASAARPERARSRRRARCRRP